MNRSSFNHDNLTLSYLDSGCDGPVIIALHAAWMDASSYEGVSRRLFPAWRVVSLDQRGHGHSDHANDYSRHSFVEDIAALLDHLGIKGPVVLMGNSLGTTNAFQFAARYPDRVRAMIIEEAAAEEDADLDFVGKWSGTFPTRAALAEAVGERLYWSVAPSVRETSDGFKLAFAAKDIMAIAEGITGDWWADWLGSKCPALLIEGSSSPLVDGAVLRSMAERRPKTRLTVIEGGHVVHEDNLAQFVAAVKPFLEGLGL